jgi:hypothetical protein
MRPVDTNVDGAFMHWETVDARGRGLLRRD